MPSRGRWLRLVAVVSLVVSALTPGAAAATDEAPEQPPSFGQAGLYHMTFAADVDFSTFLPVNNTDVFVEGSPYLLTLVGWQYAPVLTELRLRLYLEDRLVYEDTRYVLTQTDAGYVFIYVPEGGAELGTYTAQLDYNGVPEETASFRVVSEDDPALAGGGTDQPLGGPTSSGAPTPSDAAGTAAPSASADPLDPGAEPTTGPVPQPEGVIPYADPASVLVVTREAILRAGLGTEADAVLAAAALVGDYVDLEADGVTRDAPDELRDEIHRLLEAGGYEYLLILGNDDAVPFFRLENPMVDGEAAALEGWQLPADWYPSDDPYTDLDGDTLGVPDLPIARIPSTDDAALLLTQLGEVVSPAGGGYAYLNQSWRAHSGVVSEVMDDFVPMTESYSPPNDAARMASIAEDNGRFFYVSMHGIGADTSSFVADVYAWIPTDFEDYDAEWVLERGDQLTSMDLTNASAPGGVIKIGTCYGAWTLDTIVEPSEKTADNSIALSYLRSGTRAVVGETHISYAYLIGTEGPYISASGYEILFWRHLLEGMTPIDAFHQAKVDIAEVIQQALDEGEVEIALINQKTLHEEVYFGRP